MMYERRAIFFAVMNLVTYSADLSQLLLNIIAVLGNPSLLCVLGSHLLIHLREADDEGRSYGSKSLSSIDFEQGAKPSDFGKHGFSFSLLQSTDRSS